MLFDFVNFCLRCAFNLQQMADNDFEKESSEVKRTCIACEDFRESILSLAEIQFLGINGGFKMFQKILFIIRNEIGLD